ncbi:hypothetical protein [Austwickia sp. TVS 96-490-7B]|uniref:hypothetical protein n=1 Tax=Austwickia sp. TVS 96-490-7B TaxID=2830843 RepID=UPI001C589947|nr:hypothetical protein [Austwickia sp. TVS 96-490-7B]
MTDGAQRDDTAGPELNHGQTALSAHDRSRGAGKPDRLGGFSRPGGLGRPESLTDQVAAVRPVVALPIQRRP